ncbi:hypothetical protein CISIN_1g039933mg, partial [Citrus sinensis]
IETNPVNTQLLERDPGLRPQIWVNDVNQRDEIHRAYIMVGPYQPRLSKYPKYGLEKHPRRFQSSWFDSFPSRLEYSPVNDAVFCLPCYLFNTPSAYPKCNAYISKRSLNRGNFLQLLKAFASNNEKIAEVILDKAPKYASYTSPDIEKEILHIFSMKVKKAIREEIRDAKFCLIVDESRDESKKKQMAVVLRFSRYLMRLFLFIISVNIVGDSCKCNDELKRAQAIDIEYMISIDELESGKGLNQIGTLQRHGDTRWSSYFRSVSNLIKMFSATCFVLLNIIEDDTNAFQRGDANAAYEQSLIYFAKLCNLNLKIFYMLCILFHQLKHLFINLEMMVRARHQEDNFTVAEHYRVNLFYVVIDCQLQELSSRFNEHAVQLLILSSALDPRECRELFRIGDVYQLADKFYPTNFTHVDKMNLKIQLEHYEYYSQWLVSTRKGTIFSIVYRIIVLVLTLPVSTPTMERSFSTMRIVKTRLRNKIEGEFLTDSLIMYIEREIAEKLSIESIVNKFRDMNERRVPF